MKLPIDSLGFDYSVPKDSEFVPEYGGLIYGLFLEGAKWDKGRHALTDSSAKILFNEMPMIWIKPTKISDISIGMVL